MDSISKKKIIQFLLLTFSITWLCFGVIILGNMSGKLLYGTPLFMILFIIGGNGAPIALYILFKRWNKIRNISDFLKKIFLNKITWQGAGLVLIFLSAHFIIQIISGQYEVKMPLYFGILMLPMTIIGGGLEEIGWRGFFQPSLEKAMSFAQSSCICALLWSLWHLPLWFINGTYQSQINFYMFVISVFGMSFMLAAVRKVTNNVLLCILLHSLINSFSNAVMVSQNITTVLTMILEIALSMAVIYVYNKKAVCKRS